MLCTENGKKKKKTWKKKLLIGFAVVLTALLAAAAVYFLPGFYMRHFAKPEAYFNYVMEKSVDQGASLCATMYEGLLEQLNTLDRSVELEMEVSIDENVMELLSLVMFTDLSWLRNPGVSIAYSSKEQQFSLESSVSLNEEQLISANAIYDIAGEEVYIQVPELSETYLRGEMISGTDIEALESLQRFYESCPDSKVLKELLKKYGMLAVGCIEEVEKGRGELAVEGIEQDSMTLTAEIDGDMLQKMALTVLYEMKEDEMLHELIGTMAEGMGMESETILVDFLAELDERIEEAKEPFGENAGFLLVLYVDGGHRIAGIDIEADTWAFHYAMPIERTSCGIEVCVDVYEESVCLIGSGTLSGTKVDGNFVLKYNDVSYMKFEVDDLKLMRLIDGYLDGCFTISLAEVVNGILGFEIGFESLPIDITNYGVELDIGMKKNATEVQVALLNEEEAMATIFVSYKMGKGKSCLLPSSEECVYVRDEEDLTGWANGIDWEAYIDRLRESDIPDRYLDYIESYFE